ncbi:hypothetical protein LPW11_20335 [Geomonas sp. RF6]|uniref:hypothetical protein n=1 Tax=Geomonas sp. RF6 TaxID=2897342 RepID=UPI001E505DD3|nr:hypothetical protein [Geomonas sp. RF6]UFS70210.1 hypothetical protein LPW11_20335 [Geomonas sp. RF6]
MATKCDPIRSQLYALQEELKKTPMFLNEATEGSKPELNPAWVNLDSHLTRTRMSLQVCEERE